MHAGSHADMRDAARAHFAKACLKGERFASRFGGAGGGEFFAEMFGGRGFGGGGGGRGGRRRMFDQTSLRMILLTLLAEEPRHGYDLIREIEARSGGVYAPSPGVVYPTLTLIADMGHAVEQPQEGGKKLYAITQEGRAWLESEAESVAVALDRLKSLAAQARSASSGPVRRAVANLVMAARERVHREGADDETALSIAAIIDEAVQKIERLK